MLIRIILTWCVFIAQSVAATDDLMSLVNETLTVDPRIQSAQFGANIGRAREQQALSVLYPQVGVTANWTENDRTVDGGSNDSFPGERYSLVVRQTLFDKAKYHGWQRSKFVTSQFDSQQMSTESEVLQELVERYFGLIEAGEQVSYVTAEKRSTEQRLIQIQTLFDRQRVKVTDLLQTQARLDSLYSDEIEAINLQDIAKAALSELIERTPQHIAKLRSEINYPTESESLDYWLAQAVQFNTKLNELQYSIGAAGQAIKQEQSGYYPTVELQLTRQQSNIGFENSQATNTRTDTIGINLNIPLYSGGQTRARIYETTQQLLATQSQYEREHRLISKRVKESYLSIISSLRRMDAMKKAIQSAEKSQQAMNRSFDLGVATVIDVLDVDQELRRVKRDLQKVKYQYITTRTALYALAGRLDQTYLEQINDWLE
ncbi:MAG: TolC family outer membrane protein [Methylococcaceae bacterium]|nr:TolC family outer membrane protein [Methylococcaceae bacterium]